VAALRAFGIACLGHLFGAKNVDIMTPTERSKRMSLIRSKDTQPELLVRRLVHSMGYRYRSHESGLPGKPDIVFKSRQKVIFVHGCFWHLHRGCGRPPKSKLDYWRPKLERNVARDKLVRGRLRRLGWQQLVVWECELDDRERLIRKIGKFLGTVKTNLLEETA
jgi:DNA mismatch endonuclease, patch repair protein